MNNKSKVYVAGFGMVTPIGEDVQMTAASIRAGISGFEVSEFYNKNGLPFTMALLPGEILSEKKINIKPGLDMTLQMEIIIKSAANAIKQAMMYYAEDIKIPLFFSAPEYIQRFSNIDSSSFIECLINYTNVKIDVRKSRMLEIGRAGVINCVDMAIRYLQKSGDDYVLVGGADSYRNDDLLDLLDKDNRIIAEGVMNGFIPGEAAGFLLLTNNIKKAYVQDSGVISLNEPGISHENGHIYSAEPYLGNGLTDAFKKTLTHYSGKKINRIYSSMNGEQFWAKEYGVAKLRTKNFFANDIFIEHPADCLGDTGSATGALLIALAAETLLKEGRENTNLVYCSSDRSCRGALCVSYESVV